MRAVHRLLAAASTTAIVAACAVPTVQPAQPRDEVLRSWGAPTARYALPEGGERIEYATGPFGRTTWMIDFDAAGRARGARQVLGEPQFAEFMPRAPGLTREQLLQELGTPGERKGGGRQGGELWSWRYPTNDCLWFQVALGDDARVRSAGYGIDPACDGVTDRT